MIRLLSLLFVSGVLICGTALAQNPPFSSVTITGKTADVYNKVCLLKGGSEKIPLRTVSISDYDHKYRLAIRIPTDMVHKGDYYSTDMRFLGDNNRNGKIDPGEPLSCCHFIIWVPATNALYMQVYEGPTYPFASSTLEYDYLEE